MSSNFNVQLFRVLCAATLATLIGCGNSNPSGEMPRIKSDEIKAGNGQEFKELVVQVNAPLGGVAAEGPYRIYGSRAMNTALSANIVPGQKDVSVMLPKLQDGERDILALKGESGNVVMMAVRLPADSGSPAVTVESTALAFVLSHPQLGLIEPGNESFKDITRKINKHPVFPKIVDILRKSIESEPLCPVNYRCNTMAAMYAGEIVESIDFSTYKR